MNTMDDVASAVVDFNVSVVLPAGGSGERFACSLPKQYSPLIDHPIILHTVTAFHRIAWVTRIAVVVNRNYMPYIDQLIQDNNLSKVVIVEGCSTRHRSIYAGVKAVTEVEDTPDVVIIHDAVRPFIDETVVQQIAEFAQIYGAAGVTRPLVSTVISADDDGLLMESLDRSRYCASEMPQGFKIDVIKTAYEKSNDEDFDHGTECLLLAMKYTGTRAKLFTGPDSLWKVTYRKDLYAAEAFMKEQHLTVQVHFVSGQENQDLLETIVTKCRSRRIKVVKSLCSESHLCNSVVFVYSDFTPSAITTNTRCVHLSSTNCDHTWRTRLKPLLLHVYDGNPMKQDNIFGFMETISDMTDDFPDVLNFGILHFNGRDYGQLSDMVTSLIWNRDSSLCGQTFVIQKTKDKM